MGNSKRNIILRIPKRVTILSTGDRVLRIVLSIFLISICVWMLTGCIPWKNFIYFFNSLINLIGIAAGLVGIFNPTLDYITFSDDDIAVYIMLEKHKHFCYEQIAFVKIANASRGRLELGELVDDIRVYSPKNKNAVRVFISSGGLRLNSGKEQLYSDRRQKATRRPVSIFAQKTA